MFSFFIVRHTDDSARTGGVSSSHVLQEDAKSGPVRCADVDVTGKYVAVVGEDKMLTLWAMRDDSVLTMTNRR